ncbi:MAG: VOC family protein, partial [Acidimicrobiales bacterium]
AGGGTSIAEPMDVGEAGRMAVFADPEGAVIGLWQAKEHRGAGLVNEPNAWTWNELMCDDPEKAKQFYAGVFGWGEVTNGDGDSQYTEWQVGGRSIGGMLKKPAEMPPMTSFWTVYIQVADIEAAAKRLSELGGQVIRPPMEIDQGTFTVVTDPAGAMFNLFEVKG